MANDTRDMSADIIQALRNIASSEATTSSLRDEALFNWNQVRPVRYSKSRAPEYVQEYFTHSIPNHFYDKDIAVNKTYIDFKTHDDIYFVYRGGQKITVSELVDRLEYLESALSKLLTPAVENMEI